MNPSPGRLRRAGLPAAVFAGAMAGHLAYVILFPDSNPAQSKWVAPLAADSASFITTYFREGAYWSGVSFAVPLAFAAAMFRRYRERRQCADQTVAVAGLTLSGVMAVAGCFLIGCCGSPMLGVYVGLLGSAFLPFAKPLAALLSIASVLLTWLWVRRQERGLAPDGTTPSPEEACACSPACTPKSAPHIGG